MRISGRKSFLKSQMPKGTTTASISPAKTSAVIASPKVCTATPSKRADFLAGPSGQRCRGKPLCARRRVRKGRFRLWLGISIALLNRRQRGVGKPETFDFLGFTHYCTTTRGGRFRLGRKPVAKRVGRTLARIGEVLRKRRHHDIWEVGRWLGRVCDGWLNYFAVPGSHRFIRAFPCRLRRLWMRALRRRSQRARFSWRRLVRMTDILWSRVSIRHPWPNQRFAVKHPR